MEETRAKKINRGREGEKAVGAASQLKPRATASGVFSHKLHADPCAMHAPCTSTTTHLIGLYFYTSVNAEPARLKHANPRPKYTTVPRQKLEAGATNRPHTRD
jgi:hypothetical protein